MADDMRAALLGAQDRQRPQHAPEKPASEGQTFIAARSLRVEIRKVANCLSKDRVALLAFYDLPAEHWKHLSTSNPIESTFAMVRHRTIWLKGCLSNRTALAMVFKLVHAAQKSWRRLDGHNQLPKVMLGAMFKDESEIIASPDLQPIAAA